MTKLGATWTDKKNPVTQQFNFKKQSSTKLPPIRKPLKKKEGYFFEIFSRKGAKKLKKTVGHLVESVDKKNHFFGGNATNWSYRLNKITEDFNDTIPPYLKLSVSIRAYLTLFARRAGSTLIFIFTGSADENSLWYRIKNK